jgi:branched-chain amino acid transport system ATP-binding protein
MPEVAAPILTLRSVTKRFGGVVAVSEIDLDIDAGQLVGVIGPNGAGKSTLLSLISGAQRPTSGEIVYKGLHRVDRKRTHEVARLGIARAHQIPRPFGRMTVRENLQVGSHSVRKLVGRSEHVDRVLELTRLEDKSARTASSLTLLDLKRLEVARALTLRPDVLLLDEVGAGLVGGEIDEIAALIRGVHAEGTTVVLVEHVQALVQTLAERVVVLDWGRAIADGTPAEIADDAEVVRIYLGSGGDEADLGPVTRHVGGDGALVLSVEGVSVDYGKLRALRAIDLEVREAEIVAVLGANGAGKSTLARCLAGLERLASGRVVMDGADISNQRPHQRARNGIALCHEGRRLFRDLTVQENLDLAAAYSSRARPREELLQRVHDLFPLLDERRNTRTGALSGGQQQMVAIARALMSDPRIVIFDELSLGLAPAAVDQIYEALPQIRAWGISIVLIEQNVFRSLSVADRVCVLVRGNVSFSGTAEALKRSGKLQEAYFGAAVQRPVGDGSQQGGIDE